MLRIDNIEAVREAYGRLQNIEGLLKQMEESSRKTEELSRETKDWHSNISSNSNETPQSRAMGCLGEENPELFNKVLYSAKNLSNEAQKMLSTSRNTKTRTQERRDVAARDLGSKARELGAWLLSNEEVKARCNDPKYNFKIQELETHDISEGFIYLDYDLIDTKGFLSEISASVQLLVSISNKPGASDEGAVYCSYMIKMFNPNKDPIEDEKYNESIPVRTIMEVRTKLDRFIKATSIKSTEPSIEMELESAEQVTAQANRAQ